MLAEGGGEGECEQRDAAGLVRYGFRNRVGFLAARPCLPWRSVLR